MKPALGVGVIGLGHAANCHLPPLMGLKPARLVAVADTDCTRLAAMAQRYGVKAAFQDYRRLLQFPGVDIVAILTPPASHTEIALAAMDAGKHIVLEKPITANLAEAQLLLERSRRCGSKICVAYTLRFVRQIQRLRQLLQAGRLGNIEILRCLASMPYLQEPRAGEHHKKPAAGGGSVIELGVHHYDLWAHLLGSQVAEVSGVTRSDAMPQQSTIIAGRMTCGTLVTTCMSLCAADQYEVEVLGSEGRAHASLYKYDGLEVASRSETAGHWRVRAAGIWRSFAELPAALRAQREGGTFLESFWGLWRHMLHAVEHDLRPEPGLEEGLESLRVGVAAAESLGTGATVRLCAKNETYGN
jgi:predicted dehydrogenase